MKNNIFHVKLIEEISNKIPQKNKMVSVLTDLLCIEREAVYRRLRGEVPFSFHEVATISRNLSVSIDELVDVTSDNISPFKIRLIEFADPKSDDFSIFEQLYRFISFINNPESEATQSTNVLPRAFIFRYETLTRFSLFKWQYHYNETTKKRYSEVVLTSDMQRNYSGYVEACRKLGTIRYILDFRIFDYLVNDLLYFSGIHMITREELQAIKADLMSLLDYMEQLTLTGCDPESGNPVFFYISNLNFGSCYSYIKTTTYHISFINAFLLNAIVSFDAKTYEKVRTWIQSQIKSSTLIIESGEVDRIRFFETQRRLVDTLF